MMLSETFVNEIPCTSHPGQKLLDTTEADGDRELLLQCINDYKDLVVRRFTHPECATSTLHFAHLHCAIAQKADGVVNGMSAEKEAKQQGAATPLPEGQRPGLKRGAK